MKKNKLPKYVQEKFTKPQFKVGDYVKYEFLGEHGWGHITKINQYNDKISYMVQGNGYTYPCGLQIKEYTSYYAGSIDYEKSKNQRNNEPPRSSEIKKRNDNKARKSISRSPSSTISDSRSNNRTANDNGIGNANNTNANTKSTAKSRNSELEDAINKQKDFLRKFT